MTWVQTYLIAGGLAVLAVVSHPAFAAQVRSLIATSPAPSALKAAILLSVLWYWLTWPRIFFGR